MDIYKITDDERQNYILESFADFIKSGLQLLFCVDAVYKKETRNKLALQQFELEYDYLEGLELDLEYTKEEYVAEQMAEYRKVCNRIEQQINAPNN